MTRNAGNGSSGRVLVVEDDEGIREMLKYNLSSAGFSVQEASDGAAGLRTARTARPDLILLDLIMPGLTGFDVVEALRAEESTRTAGDAASSSSPALPNPESPACTSSGFASSAVRAPVAQKNTRRPRPASGAR